MTVAIHQIGVVGAGTMGSGIAQVFAQKGYGVLLFDLAPAISEHSIADANHREIRRLS